MGAISAFMAIALVAPLAVPPVTAASPVRAAMRMPFPSGGRTGTVSPASHHVFHRSGFAWDLHDDPRTPVRARFVIPDGKVKVRTGSIDEVPGGAGKVSRVKEVQAVFGLPPDAQELDEVWAFKARYLPPPAKLYSILPGTGVVMLDSKHVGVGYDNHRRG